MKKVLVIGSAGSGKTTFSKELSKKTNLPLYHLDKYYWKPNWIECPIEEFKEIINNILQKDEWIIDGNYLKTLEMRIKDADTVIFMDIRTDVCVRSAIKRYQDNIGKNRDDLGSGCIEQIDDDFIDWIKNFRKKGRPNLIKIINKFPNVDIHIFKTRKAAYDFLSEINKA